MRVCARRTHTPVDGDQRSIHSLAIYSERSLLPPLVKQSDEPRGDNRTERLSQLDGFVRCASDPPCGRCVRNKFIISLNQSLDGSRESRSCHLSLGPVCRRTRHSTARCSHVHTLCADVNVPGDSMLFSRRIKAFHPSANLCKPTNCGRCARVLLTK